MLRLVGMCVLLMVVLVVSVSELIGHALAFFKNGFLDFIEVIHVLCFAGRYSMSLLNVYACACMRAMCADICICVCMYRHTW